MTTFKEPEGPTPEESLDASAVPNIGAIAYIDRENQFGPIQDFILGFRVGQALFAGSHPLNEIQGNIVLHSNLSGADPFLIFDRGPNGGAVIGSQYRIYSTVVGPNVEFHIEFGGPGVLVRQLFAVVGPDVTIGGGNIAGPYIIHVPGNLVVGENGGSLSVHNPGPLASKVFIDLNALPVFANNAAALVGGLFPGFCYRTGGATDTICVVH